VTQLFFDAHFRDIPALDTQGSIWMADLIMAAKARDLTQLADLLHEESEATDFLSCVMTLSPYLRETCLSNPHFLEPLCHQPLRDVLAHIITQIAALDKVTKGEMAFMAQLRMLKHHAHLLIALGDLAGFFTLQTTTYWLTQLAQTALGSAVRFLLIDAARSGQITLADAEKVEENCGLIVLGAGKIGAHELNYSSDIDLLIFIDEKAGALRNGAASVNVFSKMIRRLVRIMQERNEHGYVFRVDLRLRPDPGSTPLALPTPAALHYYESRGQNWERAALIKARPIAGDIAAGERFLNELAPYIWRKYLDYAAIADIHAIKRQIHHFKGYGALALRGHNIKLGRGGIREIEFFVQTQQLIAGGRLPQLRGRETLKMLDTLCELGWISCQVKDDLTDIYQFLRHIEHRIQMLHDEQSHILPTDETEFLAVSRLMGYAQEADFIQQLTTAITKVETHYAALFEHEHEDKDALETLIFTGEEDNPGALKHLTNLGFERAHDMYHIIRDWHFGRYRALQSTQARARLTQLTPALLRRFGATKQADEVLLRFDRFLQALPAGIQLFSLLQSHEKLLDMLVLIMGSAPRLADIITRTPHVFDGMLDPTLFAELPTRTYLEKRLEAFLHATRLYEETLDRLRIFAAEQRFLIGLRLLTGTISGERAGQAFSDLADLMIARALQAVEAEFVIQHGHIKGGQIAILGMGKLGSREMTAGSDVDLILLYDHDEKAEKSDGNKPLYVAQYYMRLTQRLVAALSAPTAQGILYQVDLRLRPSGNKGPVAVAFPSFGKYQRQEAWVWEHLALTRARPIAGDAPLLAALQVELNNILTTAQDMAKLKSEILAMRHLIAQEKPPANIWDLKRLDGGIIDLEFIAQYAILSGHVPWRTGQSSGDVLSQLRESFCSEDETQTLNQAFQLYTNINQIIRLCLTEKLAPETMPPGLSDILQHAAGEADISRVENLVREYAATITPLFSRLLT